MVLDSLEMFTCYTGSSDKAALPIQFVNAESVSQKVMFILTNTLFGFSE